MLNKNKPKTNAMRIGISWLLLCFIRPISSFVTHLASLRQSSPSVAVNRFLFESRQGIVRLQSNKWDKEIEENSRKKAQSGMGETAAGAVLGGILGGPFGALFGASIGSNIGARNSIDRARNAEIDRLGLSKDSIEMARDVGIALEKSNEGLKAVSDSLETQQRFAKRLDRDASELYEKAQAAIRDSNEELARKCLLERTNVQEKQKEALINCAQDRARLQKMEENVAQLERRAMEVDSLLRRNVSAKTLQDSSSSADLGLSLSNEDPLLQKFKDIGID